MPYWTESQACVEGREGACPVSLAAFQVETARRAVARLVDPRGSGRYLIADEVGLGKTHVAMEVIRLLEKKKPGQFRVVYLCSSQPIIDQNRSRLGIDDVEIQRAVDLARKKRRPARLALTPGTSLRGGTGTAGERALMLDLFREILGRRIGKRQPRTAWKRFLQMNVRDEERWQGVIDGCWRKGRYSRELLARVRRAWRQPWPRRPRFTEGSALRGGQRIRPKVGEP